MAYKKTRGETKVTIVRGMLMYGFACDDIAEITGISIYSVRTIYQNYFEEERIKYIKNLYKRLGRGKVVTERQSVMYSIEEMDYGYSGKQKVTPEDLKGEEKVIYNEIKDFGLKNKFRRNETKRADKILTEVKRLKAKAVS